MIKYVWRNFLAERVTQAVTARAMPALDRRIAAAVDARLASVDRQGPPAQAGAEQPPEDKPWKRNLAVPPLQLHPRIDGPFMAYSTCSTADFLNPQFDHLCASLGLQPTYHRKLWEWAFILHHALRTGAVGPGRRALGFAVGSEPLPSAFAAAGASVVATDAPAEIGIDRGWRLTGEYAAQLDDMFKPDIIERDRFLQNVQFKVCDMTRLPADLTGFDFCWSACSFEHLGSIAAGLDFVLESVEKTLRPGGVACHTTEFNWSSDSDTADRGETVLYRKSDLLGFIDRLERRGHTVAPLRIAPDTHVLDFFVDTPPYSASPHLKLRLLGYVSTSVGLVITRGAG